MHLERPSLQAIEIEMACGKRGRSSCGLAAFGDATDSAPLRKLACTLFNQGLRRLSPVGADALQGCAGRVAVAPALAEDGGHEACRSEACGLFNGALHQHHSAPADSHLLVDGQVHGSTVTEMAAQRRRIAGRFAVLGEVGRGAFGVVVRAWDTASQAPVAIKIVRRGGRHHLDAVMEAEKLEILRWRDREHKFCVCVKFVCDYQGHVCLVTELLGSTLLSALRDLRVLGSSGVQVETARRVAAQLCEALEFLRRSRLIHADLKTENICLAQPGMTLGDPHARIKLIDFGCATWEGGPAGSLVQTVQYRAPEVCLGLAWTFPCDMWSVGCILFELLEGERVFDVSGHTGSIPQHLAMMQRLTGQQLPPGMVQRAASELMFCTDRRAGRLLWPEVSGGDMLRERNIDRELEVLSVTPLGQRISHALLWPMREFLAAALHLDPDLRLKPRDALSCQWLREDLSTPCTHSVPRAALAPQRSLPSLLNLVQSPVNLIRTSPVGAGTGTGGLMAGDAFDVAGHTSLPAAPVPPPQLRVRGSSLGSFHGQLQLGVGGTGIDGCGSKSDLLQRQMRHTNSGCGVGLPLLQRSPHGGAIEKERLLIEKERLLIDHPHEKERLLVGQPHFAGPASWHILENFVQQLSPYRQTDLTSCGSSPFIQTERDLLHRQKRPIEKVTSFETSPYRQTDFSSFAMVMGPSNTIAALSTLTSDSGGGGGGVGGHGALPLTRARSLHTAHLSHTGPTLSPGQLSYAARAHGVVL